MVELFLGLLAIILVVLGVWLVFGVVCDMADARGHSRTLWMVVSLVWSPFAVMFVLWLFVPLLEIGEEEAG
ncbi:hypothetical protein [Aliiroseovarius sp.]|uniref:hypothetical protein n=1 Tax=Aliiroseovarius sp. TaxID=1872442 RepID=UPI00260DF16E|nr:hypothetical protein [Aliiroseovarius sp.]